MSPHYPTYLSKAQRKYIKKNLPEIFRRKLKYSLFRILEGILYVVKTGCQWNMIPKTFPKWRCVYHHFRSWSDRGWIEKLLQLLVRDRRVQLNRCPEPSVGIIDSQSVKWGTIDSVKGIDGFKRIKGIKRHLATDALGYPLSICVTPANIHDSKGANILIPKILLNWKGIILIKADKGYSGYLERELPELCNVRLECVKSNFGTSEFIPTKGRWVVERTFSWLDSFRRMCRNYEKSLHTSQNMAIVASVCFMLRYVV